MPSGSIFHPSGAGGMLARIAGMMGVSAASGGQSTCWLQWVRHHQHDANLYLCE